MNSVKKILVLGGTGAIGSHVVNILAQENNLVSVTSRSIRENKKNINYLCGNARNIDFIRSICLEHWDAIIDFMVYSVEELTERVELLLRSTDQYIFLSSARVYADAPLINENSPRLLDVCKDKEYLASKEYALVKALEENIIMDSQYGNWTIVRPSLTYAENRLQLGVLEKENWLYRALQGRSIIFSEDLMDKYYTLSYGKDVSDGIAQLVGKNEAIGQVFNIVIDEACQWKAVLNIYLEVLENKLGKRPNVILTEKSTNLRLSYAKYQVLYGRYFNRHFDNTKIKSIVDVSKWTLPEEGLKKCLNSFLMNPIFRTIDWYEEAMLDKDAGEWTNLKEIPGNMNKLRYLKWRII